MNCTLNTSSRRGVRGPAGSGWLRLSALACLMVCGLGAAVAQAQTLAQAGTPSGPAGVPAACPKAAEMSHFHLYGLWRAEFDGQAPGATLLFEKHPQFAESVRGGVNRGGVMGQVAGDVNNGDFSLDESDDGIKIAASWAGTVVENSCGKEIRGTWTAAAGKPEYSFVLRKVPGWQ